MLKLEQVSKTYGNKNEKAVDNISFEVRPGEIFGFVGPNGAGKTTTIKMIVSLLAPNSGKITINSVMSRTPRSCLKRLRGLNI